ncbi:MAG: hypothetical protein ABIG28_02115 [archaeon]
MKPPTADQLVIAVYFLSALITLNLIPSSLTTNILSIAFIIAGVYGVIALSKKKKFIF